MENKMLFICILLKKTSPASDANEDNLEMIIVEMGEGRNILPSSSQIKLESYMVPAAFVAHEDALLMVEKGMQEGMEKGRQEGMEKGRQEVLKLCKEKVDVTVYSSIELCFSSPNPIPNPLSAPPAPPSAIPAPSNIVKGDEVTRNQHLTAWIRDQLETHFRNKFVFKADEKSDKPISRFGRSKDDFCFFLKPEEVAQCLYGASVSEVSDEVELTAIDEEKATQTDRNQLLANMNKCAGDMALAAAKKGIIFRKITVFGLLVDYYSRSVTKVFKLALDFNERKSVLECEDTAHPIADAFSSTFDVLSMTLARV